MKNRKIIVCINGVYIALIAWYVGECGSLSIRSKFNVLFHLFLTKLLTSYCKQIFSNKICDNYFDIRSQAVSKWLLTRSHKTNKHTAEEWTKKPFFQWFFRLLFTYKRFLIFLLPFLDSFAFNYLLFYFVRRIQIFVEIHTHVITVHTF